MTYGREPIPVFDVMTEDQAVALAPEPEEKMPWTPTLPANPKLAEKPDTKTNYTDYTLQNLHEVEAMELAFELNQTFTRKDGSPDDLMWAKHCAKRKGRKP